MTSDAVPPATELRHGTASVRCTIVPWDTRIMGVVCGQLEDLTIGNDDDARALLADVLAWSDSVSAGFVSCRLDHRALRESMAIESIGFRYVETILRPTASLAMRIEAPVPPLDVAHADPSDISALAAIAEQAFATGRFAMDWRLPGHVNGERYAAWVRGSIAGGVHQTYAARQDGEVVGLFITEDRTDGTAYWHLTAIDPARQGQGLGLRLWRSMLRLHRDHGMRTVETRISSHNTAVLNLYARLGFRFGDPEMTFHWVRSR